MFDAPSAAFDNLALNEISSFARFTSGRHVGGRTEDRLAAERAIAVAMPRQLHPSV